VMLPISHRPLTQLCKALGMAIDQSTAVFAASGPRVMSCCDGAIATATAPTRRPRRRAAAAMRSRLGRHISAYTLLKELRDVCATAGP
jgi:hypothetical protein